VETDQELQKSNQKFIDQERGLNPQDICGGGGIGRRFELVCSYHGANEGIYASSKLDNDFSMP
jgi:hypothetical protein